MILERPNEMFHALRPVIFKNELLTPIIDLAAISEIVL